MKYIITESQYNKVIDRFLTYQFEPHEEKTSKEHPDSILWIKNGRTIVEIEKLKYFWVDKVIWNIISDMFSLEHDETKSVINQWLKENYDLGGLIPTYTWD